VVTVVVVSALKLASLLKKGNGRTIFYTFNEDMTMHTKDNTHALMSEVDWTKT